MRSLYVLLCLISFFSSANDIEKFAELERRETFQHEDKIIVVGDFFRRSDNEHETKVYLTDVEFNIIKEHTIYNPGYKKFVQAKNETNISIIFTGSKDGFIYTIDLNSFDLEKKSTSVSNKHEKQSQYSSSSRAFIGNYIYTASNQNAYNNNLLTINIETGESTKQKLPAIKGEKSNRWIYHSESHNGHLYISSPLKVDGKMGLGYHKLENGKITESKFIPLGTDLYPHFTYKLKSSKNGVQAYGSLKEKKFSYETLALFYYNDGKTTIINKDDISATSGEILSKGKIGFDFRELLMNNGKTFIVLDAFRVVSIPEGGTRNNYKMTILLACDDAGKVEWETTHTTRDDFEGTNLRQNLFYGSILEISSSKLKVIYVGKNDLNIGVLGFDKSVAKKTVALDEISNAFNLEATESLINSIGEFRHKK
jgi:hypothetical protein